jgi:hypothetical protein
MTLGDAQDLQRLLEKSNIACCICFCDGPLTPLEMQVIVFDVGKINSRALVSPALVCGELRL